LRDRYCTGRSSELCDTRSLRDKGANDLPADRSVGEGVVAVDGGEGLARQVQDQETALGEGLADGCRDVIAAGSGQGRVQQERQVLTVRADDRRVPADDQRV